MLRYILKAGFSFLIFSIPNERLPLALYVFFDATCKAGLTLFFSRCEKEGCFAWFVLFDIAQNITKNRPFPSTSEGLPEGGGAGPTPPTRPRGPANRMTSTPPFLNDTNTTRK